MARQAVAVGTIPAYTSIAVFGDSIGQGFDATAGNGWAKRLATAANAALSNQSQAGTVLQNSADATGNPQAGNGRDRFQADLLGSAKKEAVFIAYGGFNDGRYMGAPSTFNAAAYQADLREVVIGLILGGYPRHKIHIHTAYYITDTGLETGGNGFSGQSRAGFEAFVQAARAVAAEFGTQLCDLYTLLNRPDYIADVDANPDRIHPRDAGHLIIFEAVTGNTGSANDRLQPATVTAGATGSTVTVSAATVAGATGYDYALIDGLAQVASNTSGSFTGVTNGTYVTMARATFADGSKGPWTLATATVTVAAGPPAWVTVGETGDYAGLTNTSYQLDAAASPVAQGAWTKAGWSVGTCTLRAHDPGDYAIVGPAVGNGHPGYTLASAALGNGVAVEADIFTKSNTGNHIAGVAARMTTSGAINYIAAQYDGTRIKLVKLVANDETVLATHTVVFAVGSIHTLRLEVFADVQNVYLDDVLVCAATEPDSAMPNLGTGLGTVFRTIGGAVTYAADRGPQIEYLFCQSRSG